MNPNMICVEKMKRSAPCRCLLKTMQEPHETPSHGRGDGGHPTSIEEPKEATSFRGRSMVTHLLTSLRRASAQLHKP